MKKNTKKAKKTAPKKKLAPKPIPTISLDDLLCYFRFDEFIDALSRRTDRALEYGKNFLKEDEQLAADSYAPDLMQFEKTIAQDKKALEAVKAIQVSLKDLKKNHKLLADNMKFSLGL